MPRAVCVFLCCLIASLTVACDRTEANEVVDPAFFELVSVRRESDDQHNIAVTARDGETWYRAEAAIVNLRHVDRAFETSGVDDGRAIGIMLRDPDKRLFKWTTRNRGESLGVFFESRLTEVATVQGTLSTMLMLAWSGPDEAYARALAGLRCGGDPKQIEQIAKEVLADLRTKRAAPNKPQAHAGQPPSSSSEEFPPTARPDYFEIVLLREKAEEVYVVEMRDDQGGRWYRSPKALIDLNALDRSTVRVIHFGAPARFGVQLEFSTSGLKRVEQMNRDITKHHVGLVIDNKLRMVGKLSEPLTQHVMVYGFSSLDRATDFGGFVLAGGNVEEMRGKQKRLTDEFLMFFSDTDRAEVEAINSEEKSLTLANVKVRSQEPVQAEMVNVNDLFGRLSLVELRSKPDDDFPIEVADLSERKWFRRRLPIMGDADFDFDRLMVSTNLDDRFGVVIALKPERRKAFAAWCRQHRGGRLGVLVHQRCVRTFELRGNACELIELQSFNSHLDAAEFLRLCRMSPK